MTAALQVKGPTGLAMIGLDQIDPSPTNPRKTFTGIDELAESLLSKGPR